MPINLLPLELKPKGYILKLSQTLKKIALAGVVIFLSSAVLMVGAFLIVSGRLKSSLANQEVLKSQIKAAQQTEQTLLLTKDRLGKIQKIVGSENAGEEVKILNEVLEEVPSGMTFTDADLQPEVAEITVIAGNSSQLSELLAVLKRGSYKMVEVSSLTYQPNKGYEVKISLVR